MGYKWLAMGSHHGHTDSHDGHQVDYFTVSLHNIKILPSVRAVQGTAGGLCKIILIDKSNEPTMHSNLPTTH